MRPRRETGADRMLLPGIAPGARWLAVGAFLIAPGLTAGRPHRASAPTPPPTTRLTHETSPSPLQHAHNPVDWYPWGEEAFAKAKREEKPIFLPIGYSACHWCHV